MTTSLAVAVAVAGIPVDIFPPLLAYERPSLRICDSCATGDEEKMLRLMRTWDAIMPKGNRLIDDKVTRL